MKAKILELKPALRSEIEADPLLSFEIIKGNMKVEDGRVILDAHDLIKKSKSSEDASETNKKQTKQSRFEAQLKEKGYKRIWVDPDTLLLGEQVKGVENIKSHFTEMSTRLKRAEEALEAERQECSQIKMELNRLQSRNFIQRLFNI